MLRFSLVLVLVSLCGCSVFNNGLRAAGDRCQADYDACLDACERKSPGTMTQWDLWSGMAVASCVQHCNERSTTCHPFLAMPEPRPAAMADGGRRPTPSPSATCLPPVALVCELGARNATRGDGP